MQQTYLLFARAINDLEKELLRWERRSDAAVSIGEIIEAQEMQDLIKEEIKETERTAERIGLNLRTLQQEINKIIA